MKKNKIIYWTSTGLFSLMMLFSAFQYITNPQMEAAFKHLGFSNYFRIELAFAKIIGAIVLLVPIIPARIKEWAYVGFGIVLLSASIAHISSGDNLVMVIMPVILLTVLVVSNLYLHKLQKSSIQMAPTA